MNSPSTYTKLFFVSLLTTGLFAQGPDFSASISADGGTVAITSNCSDWARAFSVVH